MADYNVTRATRQILKRYRKEQPSLVLHLYPTHFRFQEQHGNFSYDSPMKCFLEAIREQKLPTDLLDVLDEAGVRYYEGNLIVEVHDHRSAPVPATKRPGLALSFQLNSTARDTPAQSKAEVYRIVLGPNPATLWTDLGIMEKRWATERVEAGEPEEEAWTEERAVELEAFILNRTTPALCLSPSIQTSRIANSMLRATTLRPVKRKRFCGSAEGDDEGEEGEEGTRKEREERERIMKIGDEGVGRGRGHAFSRLAFIQSYRERQAIPLVPAPVPSVPTPTTTAPTVITSLRLGGPSLTSGSSTPLPAHSPPTPAGQVPVKAPMKKKISIVSTSFNNSNAAAISNSVSKAESEVGTPVASTSTAPPKKKLSKKAAIALALAGSLSLDPTDPTLPTDPAEKEKVLAERKKLLAVQKRNAAKDAKARQMEKKKQKQIEEMQSAAALNGLFTAP